MILSELLQYFDGVKRCGDGYTALCPAHGDNNNSLSISEAKDGKILLHCFTGCEPKEIVEAVGLTEADLFNNTAEKDFKVHTPPSTSQGAKREVAKYNYYDLDGALVAIKHKYVYESNGKKLFTWEQPGGKWSKPDMPIMYNWYAVKDLKKLFFVEGEKDVDTLARFRLPAVSVPNGANSWDKAFENYFNGREVIIIPDNDKNGQQLAQKCVDGIIDKAASVKVVNLCEIWKDIPEKADVTDFIEHGGTVEALIELVRSTKPLTIESAYVDFNELEAQKTKWLWFPYIPRGKITLMTADPGTGKTFFSLYLAAMVTNGAPFFGQESFAVRVPQTVIYQTAEDGLADTIKPRLLTIRPEANLKFFKAFDESKRTIDFSSTPEIIEKIMKDQHPALMIFDPLQAYLGANVDMHRANEVRPVLANIGRLAEEYECAVILIMHNSKMSTDPLYRALGSIDFVGIARSMLIMGKHPDDSHKRVVCHEKSSLAAPGDSIVFHIDPSNGGIVFDEFSDLKAVDVLNAKKKTREKPSIRLDEAVEMLRELLGEEGWTELSQVKTLEAASGVSERSMQRAKKELGLETLMIGYGNTKCTYWLHPDIDKEKFKKERLFEGAELLEDTK